MLGILYHYMFEQAHVHGDPALQNRETVLVLNCNPAIAIGPSQQNISDTDKPEEIQIITEDESENSCQVKNKKHFLLNNEICCPSYLIVRLLCLLNKKIHTKKNYLF